MSEYPWQQGVRRAVLEYDLAKQEEKIQVALRTLEARRAELDGDVKHDAERRALAQAEWTLNVLRSKR
jgi:hypothetical protein